MKEYCHYPSLRLLLSIPLLLLAPPTLPPPPFPFLPSSPSLHLGQQLHGRDFKTSSRRRSVGGSSRVKSVRLGTDASSLTLPRQAFKHSSSRVSVVQLCLLYQYNYPILLLYHLVLLLCHVSFSFQIMYGLCTHHLCG